MRTVHGSLGRRVAVLIAVVAGTAVVATAALGASAATNPKTLALRASDFPAGTKAWPPRELRGSISSTYTASFSIRPGDLEREQVVTIQVWVAKDVAGARDLYQGTLETYTGKGPKVGEFAKAFKGEAVLPLSGFGDEQFADYLPNPQRAHGQLIVRKGTVVWFLTVENCSPLAPYCDGSSRLEAPITKAKALAELKNYGAKQKRRVG